jgi:hypothetical protein
MSDLTIVNQVVVLPFRVDDDTLEQLKKMGVGLTATDSRTTISHAHDMIFDEFEEAYECFGKVSSDLEEESTNSSGLNTSGYLTFFEVVTSPVDVSENRFDFHAAPVLVINSLVSYIFHQDHPSGKVFAVSYTTHLDGDGLITICTSSWDVFHEVVSCLELINSGALPSIVDEAERYYSMD